MKQTRTALLIFAALITGILLMSCDVTQHGTEYGSLTVKFPSSKEIFTRTIMPSGPNPLDIDHYIISGTGPDGHMLSAVSSTTSTVTIDGLIVGNWTFTATAYNGEGNPLATGNVETYIIKNTNSIDLPLQTVVGEGSMNLSFSWETTQVNADTLFSFTLQNSAGETVEGSNLTSDMNTGTCSVTKTLPAGFYTFNASLIHDEVLISGYTESVRIIAETASQAAIAMEIGKVVDNVSMIITDETDRIIPAQISVSNEAPTAGQDVTLTCNVTLPAGMSADTLTYQWYADGCSIGGATGSTYTVVGAGSGTVRYDVTVGTAENPIMGSAGYSVKIKPVPTIQN